MRTQLIALAASIVTVGFAVLRPPAPPVATAVNQPGEKVSWHKDIAPLIQKSCASCHTGRFATAKLRMNTPEEMKAGGVSGPLYVPGKPEESQLWLRVTQDTAEKPIMPPGEHQLSKAETELIRRWIAEGAVYDAKPIVFAQDVQPILKQACLPCHTGPSAQAKFDMSTPAGLAHGGVSGAAIVPGKPEESFMIHRVKGPHNGMEQMPPGPTKLTAQQIETLSEWIRQGAKTVAEPISFKRQVEPLIARWCLPCHQPENVTANLDMSSREAMLKGGDSGPLFVPGKADESLIVKRLTQDTIQAPQMPPGERKFTDAELQIIKDWINQGAKVEAPRQTMFARDIAPIFKAYCSTCHTADNPTGGLDLMTPAKVQEDIQSGRLAKAGDPDASELIRRVKGLGGKAQMPKGFAPLSAENIAKLELWVREGAHVEEMEGGGAPTHWAYIAPVRPAVPGAGNAIDAFLADRLKQEGLEFSPEADRETLIRRASLDITGLPPSLAQIDAFLADKRPDAWERLVDQLLASPHYGERMARVWMDLARYADTNGYEKDQTRSMWPWRDWVIRAYNQNMPFDQFTIEQIAGDMMPTPSQSQLIATGFHRNSMQNLEGGVNPFEAHHEVVMDRANTTGLVWLAATMECARCHDHKFDPITHEDYHRLYAFFNNAQLEQRGSVEYSEMKLWEPSMKVGTPEQLARLDGLMKAQSEAAAKLTQESAAEARRRERWKAASRNAVEWRALSPQSASTQSQAKADVLENGDIFVSGENPDKDAYLVKFTLPAGSTAIRLTAVPDSRLAGSGSGRSNGGNFVLSRAIIQGEKGAAPFWAETNFTQSGYDPRYGLSDDSVESGWAVGGGAGRQNDLILQLQKPWPGGQAELVLEFQSRWTQHGLGRFRLASTLEPWPLTDLLSTEARAAASLADFSRVDSARRPHYEAVQNLAIQVRQTQESLAETRIMRDSPNQDIKAPIYDKGSFATPGRMVEPGAPSFLPPLPADAPKNRFGLAQWLVSRSNPLTARVQVNRMWEVIWGRGIVKTSDDFGTQGSAPTHPELLDWMAVEFMENGWDTKQMLRLIFASRAYRQESALRPELAEKDPENKLIARGPRRRLEAEAIRDTILTASGLMSPTLFGPSVMPPQPQGIWNSPYSGEQWMQSEGGNAWRRSLYTFWKRTAAYPALMVFDATSRELCTIQRQTTNTPLQALNLLNDEQYFLAAQSLGRIMATGGGLAEGFRRCTGRRPTAPELSRLEKLRQDLLAEFRANPADSAKVAPSPDLAAWTMTANVLLNLDETISQE
jgi:mono/diheme cytochrome c family protein